MQASENYRMVVAKLDTSMVGKRNLKLFLSACGELISFSNLTGVNLGRGRALPRAVAGLAAQRALRSGGGSVGGHGGHHLDGHRAVPLVVRGAGEPVDHDC